MPWAPSVKAILEAWYPGIGGGQAIANLLFGRVNPSGKLPVTFAATEADLPHPRVTGLTPRTGNNGADAAGSRNQPRNFPVDYNVEGMAVGYRWFQEKNIKPLFPFGFGLSYTHFAYSNLKVNSEVKSVTFDLSNTGTLAGDEIAQVYVTLPASAGEPFRKLAGWKRIALAAGASQTVEIPIDPLYLCIFSTADNSWFPPTGIYLIEVGGSSASLPLHQTRVHGEAADGPPR
jgi:beta-glucosidase